LLDNGQFKPSKYLVGLLQTYSTDADKMSEYERLIVDTAIAKYGDILMRDALKTPQDPKLGDVYDTARTVLFGPDLVLGHIGAKYQLENMLTKAFGSDMAADILSLVWFVVLEGNALSNNDAFLHYYESPCGGGISSQDVTRLLDDMNENGIMSFYKQWLKFIVGKSAENVVSEKILYDLTSISFTGRKINSAEYGYNRDKESLPQVNYAMLCLRGSGMPVFAWSMNGSISDVKTLVTTLQYLEKLEYKPECLMMDRAFGIRDNITYMFQHKHVFLQSLKVASNWVYRLIDFGEKDRLMPISQLKIHGQTYYGSSTKCLWVCTKNTQKKDAKDEIIVIPYSGKRGEKYRTDSADIEVVAQYPCTVHVAFCQDLVGSQHDDFMSVLKDEHSRLMNDKTAEVKKEYEKYFVIRKEKYARNREISFNLEAIEARRNKYEGYICYLSNDSSIGTMEVALKEYSTRDVIEKNFDDMKNALDMRRLHVHTEYRMRSRLFIQFIAEIFRCHIRQRLSASESCKKMTQSQFANHVKTMAKTKFTRKYRDVFNPLSKTQRDILEAFDIAME
jgi:transposase